MEAPRLCCLRVLQMSRAYYTDRFLSTATSQISSQCFSSTAQSPSRHFSSAAQTQSSDLRSVFRTNEDDPRQHTLDHVGLYYKIPEQELNTVLKGCIHPWHKRLMQTFNEPCVMVRKQAVELNGYIQSLNLSHPVTRFVLYGKRGAGKSNVMLQTIQACHRDNWIIAHVPWAGKWARGWYKEVAESAHKGGRYDLPQDAANWLNHFRTQNQGKLQDLKTTFEYVWTKREKAEIGTPLEELINFGLSRVKFSSDCVGAILKELRHQAEPKGIKVLVAVSSVNAFYVQWNHLNALKNAEKKKLHPSEVSLIHNFKKMLSPTWNHGVAVCAVDEETNNKDMREDYTPLYILGQEGFEALDPFVPILVPEYTEKEALSTINYFIDRNWIQNGYGRTEEGKKEIMFVSNKNAFNLYKVCTAL